jgi:lysophospholipase L1-like esterase
MIRAISAALVLLMALAALAQPPATQPATQPTGRRGRGVVSNHPRDQLPFTNSNPASINPNLPTLFIAGDSTAATGNPNARGWGALLVDYFDSSKVNLVNMAVGGARFNTYIVRPWPTLVEAIKPGDYVLIEFGHNNGPLPGIGDETQEVPGRGGGPPTTMHTHGWYLKKFINDVREKKGIPIASTLTLRKRWGEDGKIERLKEQVAGQGAMSDWTRQVATNENVLLIDHSNIIGDIYDRIGRDEVMKLFATEAEYLHPNTAGAIINCEAFIAGLKAIPNLPLVDYLNEKGKGIPAYQTVAR